MCKLRHKLCNNQNFPSGNQNFCNYFFLRNFTNYDIFPQVSENIIIGVFPYSFLFPTVTFRMSRNMCKLRHELCKAKKGVGMTFTWLTEAVGKCSVVSCSEVK